MWETVKLEDIADVKAGNPAPQDKNLFEHGVYPFVRTSDVGKVKVGSLSDANDKLNQQGIAKLKLFPKGTILFPKSGASTFLNHRVILEMDAYVASHLATIKSKQDDVSDKYLWYFLQNIDAADLVADSAYPSLNTKTIQSIPISLPPLEEQERIVAKLDAAFAEIDEVKSSIEQNINNATSIFSTYLHEKINSISDSKELMLGDAIETLTDYHANGSYKILKNHVELKDIDDYAWMVRSTDFEKGFKNQKKYITKAAYEFLSKSKIFGNELLMSKIGNAGKIYLMPKIDRPTSLAMNMFLIRFDESIALNEYVYICLSSHLGNQQIINRLHGAATQTITKAAVRSIKIPICSLQEQKKIIFEINSMQEKTFVLSKILQKNLKNQHELKKAILSKSFLAESHHHAA